MRIEKYTEAVAALVGAAAATCGAVVSEPLTISGLAEVAERAHVEVASFFPPLLTASHR